MANPRFLTKSRFKTAYTCPRKLFYVDRPEYGNNLKENEFLEALAQGGYQVGALAKIQYQGGIDLEDLGTAEAIARTNELLKQDRITIYEAALQVGHYLVRVDILEKTGNSIRLIEVKAKGYSESNEQSFLKKGGKGIYSEWEPYLVDVAFQTWVARQLLPQARVEPYLLLANKEAVATVDRLHQNFRIMEVNGRSHIEIREGTTKETIGAPLLIEVPVEKETIYLISAHRFPGELTLPEYAKRLADSMQSGEKLPPEIDSGCKTCEFRISKELKNQGKKSGFEECWVEQGKLTSSQLDEKLIFDLWNGRRTDLWIQENKFFLKQLEREDLTDAKELSKTGERQWLQIEKVKSGVSTPSIDRDGLRSFFQKLKYPLHFIDFETSMVAIPFHQGRRPYEQMAFQFSHHTLAADGTVAHADEYIHFTPNEFPNFEFVRHLKKSLSSDNGTIFRYADHENTVLRQIRTQILALPENQTLPDAKELISFIDSITRPKSSETGVAGIREMVDLKTVITDYFYHPAMGGSNSIKKVIPAILSTSTYLQKKYPEWAVADPYKKLPPVFKDIPQENFEGDAPLFQDESIDDGGAAMTAWARMQFTEMKPVEREAIVKALLKYCELDTLSMVWIIEYLKHEVGLA